MRNSIMVESKPPTMQQNLKVTPNPREPCQTPKYTLLEQHEESTTLRFLRARMASSAIGFNTPILEIKMKHPRSRKEQVVV